MQQSVGELGAHHTAIDGKASRGATAPATGKRTPHLLRACVGGARLSLRYAASAHTRPSLPAI